MELGGGMEVVEGLQHRREGAEAGVVREGQVEMLEVGQRAEGLQGV